MSEVINPALAVRLKNPARRQHFRYAEDDRGKK